MKKNKTLNSGRGKIATYRWIHRSEWRLLCNKITFYFDNDKVHNFVSISRTYKNLTNESSNKTCQQIAYQDASRHIPRLQTILPISFSNSQSHMAHVHCSSTKPPHTLDITIKIGRVIRAYLSAWVHVCAWREGERTNDHTNCIKLA